MKKILALLMALVMALGCVSAFAEETQNNEITFELPAITLNAETTIDIAEMEKVLTMFGAVDEDTMAMVKTILPILSVINESVVVADNGVQFDLGLKGQNMLTIACEQTEDGFALATDLLPSYVITVSNETIQQYAEQIAGQMQDAFANVDMEALAEKISEYGVEFVMTAMSAVKPGDSEHVAIYDYDGYQFNTKTDIEVDLKTIVDAAADLIKKVRDDETFKPMFDAMQSAAGTLNLPTDEDLAIDEEKLPDVVCTMYTNTDDEFQATDATSLTYVETAAKDGAQKVDVAVLVADGVQVTIEDQDGNIVDVTVYMEDDTVNVTVSLNAQGISVSFGEIITMGDPVAIDAFLYFMDGENPLIEEVATVAQGGERTFAVLDENKTIITVEQLLADTEGEIANALMGDLMGNGLGGLIAKVSEIDPEAVSTIMSLFMANEGPVAVEETTAE